MIPVRQSLFAVLRVVFRLLLGAIFVWAGLTKVQTPGFFAQTVGAYKILPHALVNPFAIVVPWIEMTAGLFLILGLWTRSSALVTLFLLLSFGVALGVNVYRGADLSCGCFGLGGGEAALRHAMVRDLLLIVISAVLVLFTPGHPACPEIRVGGWLWKWARE